MRVLATRRGPAWRGVEDAAARAADEATGVAQHRVRLVGPPTGRSSPSHTSRRGVDRVILYTEGGSMSLPRGGGPRGLGPRVRSAGARLGLGPRPISQTSPLIDAKQAAQLLGVPPTWLLAQARERKVPHRGSDATCASTPTNSSAGSNRTASTPTGRRGEQPTARSGSRWRGAGGVRRR